jgi:Zn ribbon nucleic-acid-binding protein
MATANGRAVGGVTFEQEGMAMQSTCPKCHGTAFRMWPEDADSPTRMECLACGHVTTFVATITRPVEESKRPKEPY